MNQSAIGWIALAIAVFVFLDLLFVELRRIFREGKRIVARLNAYAELPVVAQAARAGDDVRRITGALDRLTPLLERARTAVATIRHPRVRFGRYDPLVPNGFEASKGWPAD